MRRLLIALLVGTALIIGGSFIAIIVLTDDAKDEDDNTQ